MPNSPGDKRPTLVAALVVTLTGLLIYEVTARELERPVTRSELSTCPPCAARRCPPPKPRPRAPRYYHPFEFSVDFFGLRYRGDVANLIDRHVLRFGAYEKHVLYFLRDALHALRGADGVFVDIGANNGHHSLFMSRHAKIVHAFEPYPPVIARFRSMIRENHLRNIVVHPVGLGERNADLPFFAPPRSNLGTGSFDPGKSGNRPAGSLKIVVGDRALEAAGVRRVDLIKLDVEGYEKPVLTGLHRTLARSRPLVVLEVSLDSQRAMSFKSAAELRAAFPPRYAIQYFVLSSRLDGAYEIGPAQIDFSRPGQTMAVACPTEHLAKLPRRTMPASHSAPQSLPRATCPAP